ncbi:helix-turn-helix domain-containing protein [Tenacibaculum agarivorans]|uniref:helix-turn-helix domain-containing protein n=1 Tax=Tenacibaculum agarivorans TaxID=1908389 RepID=UPI00094B9C07|nr:AraC family transcriptional regulator [Tenacibaculum agarivorans]
MNFHFLDLLLFVGVSQGFFLGITILLVRNKNKSANKLLSFLLFSATIMLSGRVFLFKYFSPLFHKIALLAETIIFLFGPLVYLYTRNLLTQSKKQLPFQHFIPAIIHFIYAIVVISIDYDTLILMIRQGKFNLIYFITELSALASNIIYVVLAFLVVKNYKIEEKNELSYTQNIYNYLHFLILGISTILIFWMFSFLNYFIPIPLTAYINYNSVWICTPIFIYIVGFYSLRQPEIFRTPPKSKQTISKKERLTPEETQRVSKELEHLMVDEKIYLDHKLTLVALAKQLNTSTNNLSWLLNTIHKSNFYDYVNRYRVQSFIEKIQHGEHESHTILALSLDSGFNSKSTFNKAFKEITQQTPTSFIKSLSSSV